MPDSAKVSYQALTISMALANFLSFTLGGIPLCHGAGGLAAHYRFGARTAGSNLMIGGLFLALALFLGSHALAIVYLVPMAVLGVLLLFAGSQLAMTVIDLKERKDLFVALVILGYMAILWIASLVLRNSSIVDIFWGVGFVMANWVYFALTPDGFPARKWLISILVTKATIP